MSTFKLSKRTSLMTESATLRMAQLARELREKGEDVINLSLGEPDFDTPQHIKEKAIEAIREGYTKYTPVSGSLELRTSISKKLKRENNLDYSAQEIIVSNGAKQSFANLCFALLDEGDEVIVLSPFWVSYYEIIKLAGGIPICVDSKVENNYKPNPNEIKKAINNKTRMLIFSTPCNPTGTVFNQQDLELIAAQFQDRPDILIVADEIYEHIIFDEKHFSIGSLPGMKERTATINGFSKGFSMTGWRLGYLAAPKFVVEACTKIQGQFTSGAASFTQHAGAFGLDSDLKPTHDMCTAFRNRRNVLIEALKGISGWIVNKPEGAFYVFPDVSSCFGKIYKGNKINDAEELALFLLQEAKVALVSGAAFGAPNCIRISYSLNEDKILEAVRRIKEALSE